MIARLTGMPSDKKRANSIQNTQKNPSSSDLEQRVSDFTEEIEKLGKKVDMKGKAIDSWYYRTFGIVGPLISSLIGLIVLGIFIWIFTFFGPRLDSAVFRNIGRFLLHNLLIFFGLSLLVSYTNYGNKKYPHHFKWISPVTTAVGITAGLWIAFSIFDILSAGMDLPLLSWMSSFVISHVFLIFVVILLFGYLLLLLIVLTRSAVKTVTESPKKPAEPAEQKTTGVKRLYRSGNEKIIGGVCGGIAEYVEIDPVVIRLIWIVGVFVTISTAILLYFIFWVIIPRNPRHSWD